MKMRTARRMHKEAMTTKSFDEDGLPTKKLDITTPFKQWIREHFKKLADPGTPSKKLKKVLSYGK